MTLFRSTARTAEAGSSAAGQRVVSGWLLPAGPQFGQSQVGGELAAAVPDHAAIPGRVARKADRVPGHLTRAGGAVPQPDQHPGLPQAGEELLFRARPGSGGAHLPPQGRAGRLVPSAPGRLLRLGAGGAPGGGAIRRSNGAQPEPALGVLAGFPHPVEVVPGAGLTAVLAGQGRHDVNVIRGVPDCHPPHPQIIIFWRQPRPVHDSCRYLRPLAIRQHPVLGRGTDRAVPHRLVTAWAAQSGQRLGQQPGQTTEIR